MNSLIWAWNSIPAPIAPPAQIVTPRPFSRRNDGQPSRIAPASGGAMVERPGMNFEKTSVSFPQRSKRNSVWRTQESGERETRHRSFITRRP